MIKRCPCGAPWFLKDPDGHVLCGACLRKSDIMAWWRWTIYRSRCFKGPSGLIELTHK